jgi:hypothetical protein
VPGQSRDGATAGWPEGRSAKGVARRRRPTLALAAFLVSDGPYVLVGLGMSKSLQIFLREVHRKRGLFLFKEVKFWVSFIRA